jgi:hypothetical protein
VAVAAAVFAGAGSLASPDAFLDGFAPAIAIVAALSLAGAIVAIALPGRRPAAETALAGEGRRGRPRRPCVDRLGTLSALERDGGS